MKNKRFIRGNVLEIGDSEYTTKYANNLLDSKVFTLDTNCQGMDNYIVGDLTTGMGCVSSYADCFILTQTLPFIYEINNAVTNIWNILKPGGCY